MNTIVAVEQIAVMDQTDSFEVGLAELNELQLSLVGGGNADVHLA